jgi:1-acyl-sn-glycerol-3-phosphate acyltransferase
MVSRLRLARRVAALVLVLLLCLFPHLLWKLTGRHSPWPRIFLGLCARAIGVSVRISGEPRHHDVFFIANHVSWVDILALGGATGAAFISHDGVAGWPLVGWLARQNNTIFVARGDRHAVREQVRHLHQALAGHQPVALFPEGTTSDGTGLLPFKPALLAGLMPDRKSTRLNSSHNPASRMPSSA